jgi:hypothetical protein
MRNLLFVQLSLSMLLFAGCRPNGYAELGLVDVSGTVTLDGQPLPNANVVFEGDDKRTATGVTDAAGKYKLMYDSETPGAMPGAKTVRITVADVGVEGGGAAEGAASAGKERIPARYNRQSELKADVSTSRKTFDFDLKSTL